MTTVAQRLVEAISVVCPIDGVSLGDLADKTTWRIDYKASATQQQRSDARTVLTNFDPNSLSVEETRVATFNDANGADILSRIRTLTASQIDTYIDNNVTSLATARDFLKKVMRVIVLLTNQD